MLFPPLQIWQFPYNSRLWQAWRNEASWRGAKLASGVAFSHAQNILELNVAFQSQENVVTEGGWLKCNEKAW